MLSSYFFRVQGLGENMPLIWIVFFFGKSSKIDRRQQLEFVDTGENHGFKKKNGISLQLSLKASTLLLFSKRSMHSEYVLCDNTREIDFLIAQKFPFQPYYQHMNIFHKYLEVNLIQNIIYIIPIHIIGISGAKKIVAVCIYLLQMLSRVHIKFLIIIIIICVISFPRVYWTLYCSRSVISI